MTPKAVPTKRRERTKSWCTRIPECRPRQICRQEQSHSIPVHQKHSIVNYARRENGQHKIQIFQVLRKWHTDFIVTLYVRSDSLLKKASPVHLPVKKDDMIVGLAKCQWNKYMLCGSRKTGGWRGIEQGRDWIPSDHISQQMLDGLWNRLRWVHVPRRLDFQLCLNMLLACNSISLCSVQCYWRCNCTRKHYAACSGIIFPDWFTTDIC